MYVCYIKIYKQEHDESDDSIVTEDLAAQSDHPNTPILSQNVLESKEADAATQDTVPQKTESEEHQNKEVETPFVVEQATGGLPDEGDNLRDPVAQQLPDDIDLNTPV